MKFNLFISLLTLFILIGWIFYRGNKIDPTIDQLNKIMSNQVSIARENNIEGRVFISFVVEKDGNISDVKVVRGIGGGCDEEAKRVIKSLPKFTPGKQNGRPVRVQFNVPVNFKLM